MLRKLFHRQQADPDPHLKLKEHLFVFLNGQTWEERGRITEQYPDLLNENAYALLSQLAERQTDEERRRIILERQAFLRRCREIGIRLACQEKVGGSAQPGLAERLNPILAELGRLGAIKENASRRIVLYQNALSLVDRASNPILWASLNNDLANHFLMSPDGDRGENVERAIDAFKQALTVKTRDDMPVEWARTMHNLAIAYTMGVRGSIGENWEKAIACCEEALHVRTRESMPLERARTMLFLGAAYSNRIRGDHSENLEKALEAYEQVLEIMTRERNPEDWSVTMHDLATVYKKRVHRDRAENLEKAINLHQQALEVVTQKSEPLFWAASMYDLGTTYTVRIRGNPAENLEKALELHQQALEVMTRESRPQDWGRNVHALATIYQLRVRGDREENLEKAIALYRQALEVIRRETLPEEWAQVLHQLATAYLNRIHGVPLENLEEAIRLYKQALEVRTLETLPEGHRSTQAKLGNCLLRRGRWDEAAVALRGAVSADKFLYATASTPESRDDVLRGAPNIHAGLAYALAKVGDLSEAIVALEQGRTRSLAEALELRETLTERLLPNDRALFDESCSRIHDLQREARLPEDTPGRRDFLTLSQELRKARTRLDELGERVRQYLPEFLSEPSSESIKDVAKVSPIVYLFDTLVGGLAFVIRSGSSKEVDLIWLPEATIDMDDERIRAYFSAYSTWKEKPNEKSARDAWLSALDDTSCWMWNVAMGPIIEALQPDTHATLVPVSHLNLLPWHAAWRAEPTAPNGRRYAVDSVTFSYAPSARASAAARMVDQHANQDALLAVVDPSPVSASALQGSVNEIQAAISTFTQRRIIQHREATRDRVLAALPRYPVLHFACHGHANISQPLESGLLMSNDETITVRDFLNLRHPGIQLAVLSACETSIPGVELPDEVMSLPTGLLQAGAVGAIASQWPVSDISTAMLMIRFYELWRTNHTKPATALRLAQEWIRDTTNEQKKQYFLELGEEGVGLFQILGSLDPTARDFAHPYYWGAFQYVGA